MTHLTSSFAAATIAAAPRGRRSSANVSVGRGQVGFRGPSRVADVLARMCCFPACVFLISPAAKSSGWWPCLEKYRSHQTKGSRNGGFGGWVRAHFKSCGVGAAGACWSEKNESLTPARQASISSLLFSVLHIGSDNNNTLTQDMKCVFLLGIMSIFELFAFFFFPPLLNICVMFPSDSFACLISEAERQGGEGGRWSGSEREMVAFQVMITS